MIREDNYSARVGHWQSELMLPENMTCSGQQKKTGYQIWLQKVARNPSPFSVSEVSEMRGSNPVATWPGGSAWLPGATVASSAIITYFSYRNS